MVQSKYSVNKKKQMSMNIISFDTSEQVDVHLIELKQNISDHLLDVVKTIA